MMNEHTIKAIEEQLRLRSERLALNEKEFRLEEKKRQAQVTTCVIKLLLVICLITVCIGGCGLWDLSGKIVSMEKCNIEENKKSDAQKTTQPTVPNNYLTPYSIVSREKCKGDTTPKENEDAACLEAMSLTVPVNGLALLSSPQKGNAVIVQAENKMISDRWPLVVAVMMYGLLVLAGLGVAAFTVKHIANHHNELE